MLAVLSSDPSRLPDRGSGDGAGRWLRGARDHLSRCLDQDAATSAARISLEAEVPEALFDGMRAFLSSRPEWDQYRVITSALAGFLFQNGCSDRCVAQHYLNGLFMKPGE